MSETHVSRRPVVWSHAAQHSTADHPQFRIGMDADFVLRCNVNDIRGVEGEQQRQLGNF